MTANQTIDCVPRSYDAEAAARKLADCMDYPWDQMPEKGRDSMREHARAIVSAALSGNAEQPAPVAVVLPERSVAFVSANASPKQACVLGWNACLEEVTLLNMGNQSSMATKKNDR